MGDTPGMSDHTPHQRRARIAIAIATAAAIVATAACLLIRAAVAAQPSARVTSCTAASGTSPSRADIEYEAINPGAATATLDVWLRVYSRQRQMVGSKTVTVTVSPSATRAGSDSVSLREDHAGLSCTADVR
jgi:hypothetical protein